jgi:EAL domain-containing protein (putative c-di-GMP-specific phosphodiesterase class I)
VTRAPDPDLAELERRYERAVQLVELHYQPIVHARDRRIFGWESLLRCRDPEWRGPAPILAAAERLNRWPKLGRQLRNMGAELFAAEPESRGVLFVNLHASDLLDRALSSRFAPLAKIAHRVVLEITERAGLEHLPEVRNHVADLKQMGYRIAIDDLGAGAARMKDFAMADTDLVKLDISVVRHVDSDPRKQAFIASIVGLCHEQGIGVIGEGVETAGEEQTLIGLGCDFLQGYHIARPAPPWAEVAPRDG